MHREEAIGILLTAVLIFLAIPGYVFDIEVWKFISPFLAGIFTTYVIQFRLQMESEKRKRRREMRDSIYGPMFREVSEILESIKSVQYSNSEARQNLKELMANNLFFTIKQNLKDKLSEIMDRAEKYEAIQIATRSRLYDIIREETKKTRDVDIGLDIRAILLRLRIYDVTVDEITLVDALIERITPKDFVRRRMERWGKGIVIQVRIAGGETSNTLNDFESLYDSVLQKVDKESLYHEEKTQRTRLMDELEAFLKQIRPYVVLE